jgi:hypothetical protein
VKMFSQFNFVYKFFYKFRTSNSIHTENVVENVINVQQKNFIPVKFDGSYAMLVCIITEIVLQILTVGYLLSDSYLVRLFIRIVIYSSNYIRFAENCKMFCGYFLLISFVVLSLITSPAIKLVVYLFRELRIFN